MNTSKKPRRRTLGGRLLNSLVILTFAICLSVSALVSVLYYNNQIDEYGEDAYALARTLADMIDGDKIPGYLETGKKDDHYYDIYNFMAREAKEFGLTYYYVFVIEDNSYVYVWSAESEDALGVSEEAPSEDIEYAMQLVNDPSIDEFIVNYTTEYGLLGTAWVPIFDSAGNMVAISGVDYSMPAILKMILTFVLVVSAGVIVMTSLGGYLYYKSMKKHIIRPVVLLNQATKQMVDNIEKDEEFNIDIHTGDELETLSESFTKMVNGLRKYIHELAHVTAEKERIDAELNMASRIQADALPPFAPEFANHLDLNLRGSMNTAKEMGGDFFDYFPLDDNRICFLIADVSGKGAPAALFMMTAMTMIKDYALNLDKTSEIFTAVNKRLCENNDEDMFATAWIGIIDTRTMQLQYTNAGHDYPILLRPGQPCEEITANHGLFLGGFDFTEYEQDQLILQPGDRLLLYTDGVVEAHDQAEVLYGMDRLKQVLDDTRDCPGEQVLERVFEDVTKFADGVPQFDDITMIVLTIKDQPA